jgi:predicted nucleic acid-binding Zn ribbon protein
MNCPNCGTEIEQSQQYCRSCGAGLTKDAQKRFNVRAWGILALMLIFGGMLIAMGGKMWDVKWVTFAGIVLTFGGMFGIAAFALFNEMRPRKRRAAEPIERAKALRSDATNKLPPINERDIIPSVVDDTTELLKTPAARSLRND